MRTVFNHQEVCHVWASQQQDRGRGSRIFFEGKRIFSYGYHFEMARFVKKNVVLINNRSYSVSTSKHQSYMRHAINHLTSFSVPTFDDHAENLKYFLDAAREHYATAKKSRTMIQWHINEGDQAIKLASRYADTFKKELKGNKPLFADLKNALKGTYLEDTERTYLMTKQHAADMKRQEAEDKREEQRRAREAKERIEEIKDLERWKQGEHVGRYFHATALRVKDGEVETTHNARVPIIEAKKLYRALKAIPNLKNDAVNNMLNGHRVGLFTVGSIEHENIQIGCHNIPLSEIERIAPEVMAYTSPKPKSCEDCLGTDSHEPNCATAAQLDRR